jgi:hypothetical protein
VKNSRDGDTLQAALVGKLRVIGSTSDLYHNHRIAEFSKKKLLEG